MYPNSNSLYASPLSQNVNPFAANPFALAGSIPNTMAPPFTNAPYGMVPQNPTWLQTLPQQQSPLQFTPPSATLQIALQLAAQQLAQQLTGQQLHPAALQQALHQLAQFHYWVAQQLAQLAAIPVPQGLFGSPYPNQFVPGAFGPNFGAGTLH
jgi:hypothetical protein